MKWVLPLVRHLVLEEHMTSPLMQSKAIYNPHHCTFFLIFMKCIGRRGTSVSLREFINYLAVWEKAKRWIQFWRTKWTILKKCVYLLWILEISPGCLPCIVQKHSISAFVFFSSFLFSLSFLTLVTFQRVDGGLMSNGRWVWSVFSCNIIRKLKQSFRQYYFSVLSSTCLNTTFYSTVIYQDYSKLPLIPTLMNDW